MRLANVTRICHHFIELGLIGVCEAAGQKASLLEAAMRKASLLEAVMQKVSLLAAAMRKASLLEAAMKALSGLQGIGSPGYRPADNQQICTGGQCLDR